MRRLVKNVRAAASRSNIISLSLSVVLGALTVYGAASQFAQDRDDAIDRAIDKEREQWTLLWQEIRDNQRAMGEDLKQVRDDVKNLGKDFAVLREQVKRSP